MPIFRGIAPPDFSTPVGLFRAELPDVNYTELTPPESGYGAYEEMSDTEIEGLIAAAGGSYLRALGKYYLILAGQSAKTSASIKDYDLAIDETKRSADLRSIAAYYFGLADDEDNSGEDAFTIVPTGTRGEFIPEGMLPEYERQYVWSTYRGGV